MRELPRPKAQLWHCCVVAIGLAGCATVKIPPSHVVLNETQTIDLLQRPKKWHRQTVTLKLYPFDLGFGRSIGGWSYPVCFEPCDHATADRSSFMVRTDEDRFKGYTGSHPVVVRARFHACNVEWLCNHFWAGVFVEVK
jgi:hypothetical protein